MATTPQFTTYPNIGLARLSVANPNRDGTGTIVTLASTGTSGSRFDHVDVQATGTVTAGAVRLFIYNGSSYALFRETTVTPTTPSSTVQAWNSTWNFSTQNNDLILPPAYGLGASTNNPEGFNVWAFGGDF